MSFDKIFDLTAGAYFNFYNIGRRLLSPLLDLADVPALSSAGISCSETFDVSTITSLLC